MPSPFYSGSVYSEVTNKIDLLVIDVDLVILSNELSGIGELQQLPYRPYHFRIYHLYSRSIVQ